MTQLAFYTKHKVPHTVRGRGNINDTFEGNVVEYIELEFVFKYILYSLLKCTTEDIVF